MTYLLRDILFRKQCNSKYESYEHSGIIELLGDLDSELDFGHIKLTPTNPEKNPNTLLPKKIKVEFSMLNPKGTNNFNSQELQNEVAGILALASGRPLWNSLDLICKSDDGHEICVNSDGR